MNEILNGLLFGVGFWSIFILFTLFRPNGQNRQHKELVEKWETRNSLYERQNDILETRLDNLNEHLLALREQK